MKSRKKEIFLLFFLKCTVIFPIKPILTFMLVKSARTQPRRPETWVIYRSLSLYYSYLIIKSGLSFTSYTLLQQPFLFISIKTAAHPHTWTFSFKYISLWLMVLHLFQHTHTFEWIRKSSDINPSPKNILELAFFYTTKPPFCVFHDKFFMIWLYSSPPFISESLPIAHP